jgi:hypothetical protein
MLLRFKLEKLLFDRKQFIKQFWWRILPVVWYTEKGKCEFENFGSWICGLKANFIAFVKGYYQAYIFVSEEKQV